MSTRVIVVALFCVGCGGALAPTRTIAHREPEEALGPSPEAIAHWADARAAYDVASAHGFDEAACTDVRTRFERIEGAEAIYMIGLTQRACGDEEGASASFHRALDLRPALCGARVAIGLEHDAAGRTDEARIALERAVHDDARCGEGYVNLARLQRRDPSEAGAALDNLRRALAIDARSMAAFDQMALVYLEQAMRSPADAARALDLATLVCRQAQLVDPDHAPLYNTWALIAIQRGEIVEALALLQRAMQLDPTLFEAAMNFGELTLSFRGYDDAVAAFTRASTLRPGDYDAFVGLGAAQRGLGQLDEAEASYTHAIAIDASRPEAYFDLGILYQEHRGGDASAMQRADGYYRAFVEHAAESEAFSPVVEAVTRECAPSPRRGRSTCVMGRLQQIRETLALLDAD